MSPISVVGSELLAAKNELNQASILENDIRCKVSIVEYILESYLQAPAHTHTSG